MAVDYCTQELEQAATQLLPPEIIADIGVADGGGDDTVNSTAVIERLATHLATVLGLAGITTTQHRSRPTNPTPHDQRHASRSVMAVKTFATPISPPTPLVTGADMLLLPERRQFGCGTGVFLPVMMHHRGGTGTGTGVFMPLAGACSTRPFKSSRDRGMKSPRLVRKEAQMAMRQQDDNAAVFQARPQLPALP
ncbi:hypothetical protein HU200_053232 [Digitaria exilis]|uniref:Uncharacterized protein n=1 Tax=Digitaria exilis TaxID=1010633 RepID=A0A835AXE6_9POAL|nr:hypothetical protein HU200_053232 [Digitaria exilis]